ncbi:uncharacterized protein LOC111785706 [Cucurbita pepo subsp. pepo]|uniref:uncharacterized protein LOC111785706 n=1 Tax=Cucurbita pepo subsp. pepo TaxID=3664 RepID=UPI000C9D7020|nr:uncharacterized protein LOC111785706 [Cucurbita pepo subsp. pepo]
MESVASTSSSPPDGPRLHLHRFKPSQAVADRIVRALHHHLHLLYRSNSNFFVLGATGNVYIVSLSSTPSCTCPDRITPCKHILFIYIRALGMSLDDVCLRRRTLRPCQLNRLLAAPIILESLAEIGIRRIFHQQFFQVKERGSSANVVEEGTACPVCLDDMKKNDRVVACSTCRNLVHEDCFSRWKRSKGRRRVSCVVCRARWKETTDQQKYLNLSAYVNKHDVVDNNL